MKALIVRLSLVVTLLGNGAAFGWVNNNAAIAWSQSTNAYGFATNLATPWLAGTAAVNNCGVWDCQVAVSVTNGCAALAVGVNGGGYSIGIYRALVANQAVANCAARTFGCGLLAWTCTAGY